MRNLITGFDMPTRQKGFSILEVVIGIAIFGIGMLALGAFQGALTTAAIDAKTRTEAINIAEQVIEAQRGYLHAGSVTSSFTLAEIVALRDDETGDVLDFDFDYLNIVSSPGCDDPTERDTDGWAWFRPQYIALVDGERKSVDMDGVTYLLCQVVTDYYYDTLNDTFTTVRPTGVTVSSYKTVEVTVAWGDLAGAFVLSEGQKVDEVDIYGDFGKSVKVVATISKTGTASAAKVLEQASNEPISPIMDYTPGNQPSTVPMSLGNGKAKESSLPRPDVIRINELVETRFDVMTYATNNAGSRFLRREEFAAVSCECVLRAPSGSVVGRRPTIWAGDEYTESEFVDKTFGDAANLNQSPLCDTCCRDHHDGGSGSTDPGDDPGAIHYDPWRTPIEYWDSGTFDGDHKHFTKDRKGNLILAETAGTSYVESCKLVRKDGFWRVGQDLRQEGLNVFPWDFMLLGTDVAKYSAYVTGEVDSFTRSLTDGYEAQSPPLELAKPSRTAVGITPTPVGDLTNEYTYLSAILPSQQLRSRGMYVDFMSKDLRTVINCINSGGNADTCESGDVKLDRTGGSDVLEIIPFFEVQLTWLNRWTEIQPNDPVDTTNEALRSDNTHSRGRARRISPVGDSLVHASGHRHNEGLTDTDPIDVHFDSALSDAEIQVIVTTGNPPNQQGTLVGGYFTSGVNGFQAANVEIEAKNAICDRTVEGFVCLVPPGTNSELKVSNYQKSGSDKTFACSYELTLPGVAGTSTSGNPFTVFSLDDAVDSIYYQISIEDAICAAL